MIEYRNDFIINHPIFKEAKEHLRLCFDSCGRTPDPRCTAIIGPSGSGKSTMIEDFVNSLQKPMEPHTKLVLVIETPSNPTVKAMASEVLKSIGDPMYFRGTEVQMTDRIVHFLKNLGTQLLIFDEFHNLIDKESDKLSFKASDWIKRLLNKAKKPIAIVGLDRAEEIFLVNEQLRRRFTESYFIKPFDWNKPETRKLLMGFLKAVQQKYCFEGGLEIYCSEMAYRFYCASGGLVGYMIAIVREADRLAKKMHSPNITMDHLTKAYISAVCCNGLVGINPFSGNLDQIESALKVVEGAKPIKRKDKMKSKS